MINAIFSLFIFVSGIILTILFVVGTHEFAHFMMARFLNVKVLRFSIGFGKKLFSWRDKKNTEYVFALIPLGGYVKMLDESEGPVSPDELQYAFNRQPLYKKFMIVSAGPLMNIFCAFCLYWIILMVGFTTMKPIIGEIKPHSIAYESGLKPNEEILRVDHDRTPVWTGIILRILAHAGNHDHLLIETKNLSTEAIQTYSLNLADWHLDSLNPDPLNSLGITQYTPPIPLIIGKIAMASPATTSLLQKGDKIIAVNKKNISKWEEVIQEITTHPDSTIFFTIDRQTKTLEIPVKIGHQRDLFLHKTGYLGIGPDFQLPKSLEQPIQYNILGAFIKAGQEVKDFTYYNLLLIGKMITGKLSLQSLGGPITIFESAGFSLYYGLLSFLGFLAFLSISIGIINFFPIPGLDGGHLFFYVIEMIIQKPIPQAVIELSYRIGFIVIFLLLIQAVLNDILRLL